MSTTSSLQSDSIAALRTLAESRVHRCNPVACATAIRPLTKTREAADALGELFARYGRDGLTLQGRVAELENDLDGARDRLEAVVRKHQQNKPLEPLPAFVERLNDHEALILMSGGALSTMRFSDDLTEDPRPGEICRTQDREILEGTGFGVETETVVVSSIKNGRVEVQRQGARRWVSVPKFLQGNIQDGDSVEVAMSGGVVLAHMKKRLASVAQHYESVQPIEGGLSGIAQIHPTTMAKLRKRIIQPMRHASLRDEMGVKMPMLVMMSGPTGSGKTHLVRALCGEFEDHFAWRISLASIGSAYVTETSQRFRNVHRAAVQRSKETGEIGFILLDDGERLCLNRGRHTNVGFYSDVTGTLLELCDPANYTGGRVCWLVLTNRENDVDQAFHRRCDVPVRVPAPGRDQYLSLWVHRLNSLSDGVQPDDVEGVAVDLTGEVFGEESWLSGNLPMGRSRSFDPSTLLNAGIPTQATDEALSEAFSRALDRPEGAVEKVAPNDLRMAQRAILITKVRQRLQRSLQLSDLELPDLPQGGGERDAQTE